MKTKTADEIEQDILEHAGKDKSIQVLENDALLFENPISNVYVAKTPISNACWINTSNGTILIDTLLNESVASRMRDKILETNGSVKRIIYTHHHLDHIGGSMAFKEDEPEVIAHRYLEENLEKYEMLKHHRARIASVQFNIAFNPDRIPSYIRPNIIFDHTMTFAWDGDTVSLHHERAETDDSVWVYIPEIKTAIIGDLIIAGFPNIGNPFKPTRFALSWAKALEHIRDKQPELLITNGFPGVFKGNDINKLLNVTIEAIYSVVHQVVDHINAGVPLDEMIHMVELPKHLKTNKHLQMVYSRIEFAVYNIYRWYHGYYDLNPAHLLPRPEMEINNEIFNLIDNEHAILNRTQKLFNKSQIHLALQVLDILFKKNPNHIEARKLHFKLLKTCCEEDYCLMSRNAWVYSMEQDREFLASKGVAID